MSRLISTTDARLPITPALLEGLINVLPVVCSSLYEVKLFSAVFSCSYFGLFRVSKLVLDSKKGSSSHAMDVSSIQFFQDNSSVKMYVAHSKTD